MDPSNPSKEFEMGCVWGGVGAIRMTITVNDPKKLKITFCGHKLLLEKRSEKRSECGAFSLFLKRFQKYLQPKKRSAFWSIFIKKRPAI